MKIHLSASSATNYSMPDLIRHPVTFTSMPDLIRHPGGEVAGYRLSPVWIQNAIFEVI
jgi:hypothetical protein